MGRQGGIEEAEAATGRVLALALASIAEQLRSLAAIQDTADDADPGCGRGGHGGRPQIATRNVA